MGACTSMPASPSADALVAVIPPGAASGRSYPPTKPNPAAAAPRAGPSPFAAAGQQQWKPDEQQPPSADEAGSGAGSGGKVGLLSMKSTQSTGRAALELLNTVGSCTGSSSSRSSSEQQLLLQGHTMMLVRFALQQQQHERCIISFSGRISTVPAAGKRGLVPTVLSPCRAGAPAVQQVSIIIGNQGPLRGRPLGSRCKITKYHKHEYINRIGII